MLFGLALFFFFFCCYLAFCTRSRPKKAKLLDQKLKLLGYFSQNANVLECQTQAYQTNHLWQTKWQHEVVMADMGLYYINCGSALYILVL